MDLEYAISRLEHHRDAIATLFSGIDDTQMRCKPTPEDWSLLEVMAHLHDEEREDFRIRLDILLHRPQDPWPPIDPAGWVTKRHYNELDPEQALSEFLRERSQSLSWLRSLEAPDWSSTGNTPWNETMSAGQMLYSWLAHDMLHLRQIVELHYHLVAESAAPASVDYAGGW
jgi:hypothetical protein